MLSVAAKYIWSVAEALAEIERQVTTPASSVTPRRIHERTD
jgi:hypothetical protein